MSFTQYIFECILNNNEGDYINQALVLAAMKPEGW